MGRKEKKLHKLYKAVEIPGILSIIELEKDVMQQSMSKMIKVA
ncbi:MAG: hypothetical protein ACLU5G_11490 [Blautia sp.]